MGPKGVRTLAGRRHAEYMALVVTVVVPTIPLRTITMQVCVKFVQALEVDQVLHYQAAGLVPNPPQFLNEQAAGDLPKSVWTRGT